MLIKNAGARCSNNFSVKVVKLMRCEEREREGGGGGGGGGGGASQSIRNNHPLSATF